MPSALLPAAPQLAASHAEVDEGGWGDAGGCPRVGSAAGGGWGLLWLQWLLSAQLPAPPQLHAEIESAEQVHASETPLAAPEDLDRGNGLLKLVSAPESAEAAADQVLHCTVALHSERFVPFQMLSTGD